MVTINELDVEINKIKQRNIRVEKDKQWETSLTRRILIAFGTYILVLLVMIATGTERPYLAALIPSVAFLISTASLEFMKNWWLKNN
jgi:hypothetical protein